MSNSLISVIVPVYNVENYIKQCVKSIINQTYTNLEIILVDDGSTDSSSRYLEEFKASDDRIRVLHKSNGGLSDARNAGLSIASGQYVTFVDGDDVVSPRYVEDLYYPIKHEKADFAVCNFVESPDPSPFLRTGSDERTFTSLDGKQALCSALADEGRLTLSAWGKLGAKDLWLENPFPVGQVYEDLYTIPGVYENVHVVAHVDEPLYGAVMRMGSITRSRCISDSQYTDYWKALKHISYLGSDSQSADVRSAYQVRVLIECSRIVRLYRSLASPVRGQEIFRLAKIQLRNSIFSKAFLNAPLKAKVSSILGLFFPGIQGRLFNVYQSYKRNRFIGDNKEHGK